MAVKIVDIYGRKYKIIKELTFRPLNDTVKHTAKYRFFEVSGKYFFMNKIAANYHDFWAIGENFYDTADKLEAKMFSANRTNFIAFIDKTKGLVK